LQLRILKDLTAEIVELRILKNLGQSTADGTLLIADRIEKNPRWTSGVCGKAERAFASLCSLRTRILIDTRFHFDTSGAYPPPAAIASLSNQRICKLGSSYLYEKEQDSDGQNGQNREQKAEREKQNAESRMQKGKKSPRRKDMQRLGEGGVVNSRPMLSRISYSVKSSCGIFKTGPFELVLRKRKKTKG
jgi:hypothetical protein